MVKIKVGKLTSLSLTKAASRICNMQVHNELIPSLTEYTYIKGTVCTI